MFDPILNSIENRFQNQDYEVVDLVRVPLCGDRMVRVRALEETLDDFAWQDEGDSMGYLIRVRPKNRPKKEEVSVEVSAPESTSQSEETPTVSVPATSGEGIYFPDGRLNLTYLSHNAELLFSTREFALARTIYKTILQSGERSSYALYWIARCFEAEGKMTEARANYEESIAYRPSLEAYEYLSNLLLQEQKHQEAAETMERALLMKDLPATARMKVHSIAADSWLKAGLKEAASKHYKKVLESDPRSDTAHVALAGIYLSDQRIADAKQSFHQASVYQPKNDRAWAGLGTCAMAENDKKTAHDCFVKSLELNLNNPMAVYYLIQCAYELKSFTVATHLVEEYVQSAPVNANLLYSLAGLQYHLGRLDQAGATAQRVLQMQQNHDGALQLISLIERYTGKKS